MKKNHFFLTMLVCLLAFGLVLAACGNETSKLAGIWVDEEDGESLELFKDGNGNWGGMAVTWTAEKNRFMVTAMGEAISMDYKISGKTLTLTLDGESHLYTKK